MKFFLPLLLAALAGLTTLQAGDVVTFPSPDGQFALRAEEAGGRNPALIEQTGGRVLHELDGPFRAGDRLVWSADSCWVARSQRENKITTAVVLRWDGTNFAEVAIPELPGITFKMKPRRDPHAESHQHLGHDSVVPVRWLRSGALVLASELLILDRTEQETSYFRRDVITVGFNAKHKATILNVTRGKPRVKVETP